MGGKILYLSSHGAFDSYRTKASRIISHNRDDIFMGRSKVKINFKHLHFVERQAKRITFRTSGEDNWDELTIEWAFTRSER